MTGTREGSIMYACWVNCRENCAALFNPMWLRHSLPQRSTDLWGQWVCGTEATWVVGTVGLQPWGLSSTISRQEMNGVFKTPLNQMRKHSFNPSSHFCLERKPSISCVKMLGSITRPGYTRKKRERERNLTPSLSFTEKWQKLKSTDISVKELTF